MKKYVFAGTLSAVSLFLVFYTLSCSPEKKTMTKEEITAKGKYLVNLGGCNDCHSPKIMTDMGPVPDTTKLLSGHPADEPLPSFDPANVAPGKWYLASGDLTAWIGPWGISYAQNLTPDKETGTGAWTLQEFTQALRTGKHLGIGRPILPPMPWEPLGHLTDDDLEAIFTYLQSIPPIKNQVPDPVPPNMIAQYSGKK